MMVAGHRLRGNMEQGSGLLLTQPDRGPRILRPGHFQHVARALCAVLQQQKGCRHVRVLTGCGVEPACDLLVSPEPVTWRGGFETQPRRLVSGDNPAIAGDPEERTAAARRRCFS